MTRRSRAFIAIWLSGFLAGAGLELVLHGSVR